jgi:thymidylate synthase
MPVGVPFNMIQYAAFTLMIAQILDYTPVEYLHTISVAHIYEGQCSYVEELLKREPRRLPTVTLDPTIKEILDFRPGHFTLTDYEPHEAMTVPTPV